MHSLHLLVTSILGFGISAVAAIEDCNDQSAQCCWVIKAFTMMGGSDDSISSQFDWNFDSATSCCYMKGVDCDKTSSGAIIIKSLIWNERKLSGSIPGKEFSKLPDLNRLDLGDNSLSGPVPAELGALKNMEYLTFRNNKYLEGVFPQEIADLTSLKLSHLDFGRKFFLREGVRGSTKLSGTILIYRNKQSGQFPNVVEVKQTECKTDCCKVITIIQDLGKKFETSANSANYDTDICCDSKYGITCDTSSSVIDISWENRKLSGSIPDSFSDLKKLKKLNLSMNSLTGSFPKSLAEDTSIQVLDLSRNNLSGSLPESYVKKKWDISITYQS